LSGWRFLGTVEKKTKVSVLVVFVILAGSACLSHSALVLQLVNVSGVEQHLQDLRGFWWTFF
jgi:hypothetical protein